MKEPASNSLTDQVQHEAVVEVPNGGSTLHGSHPLLAQAIWALFSSEKISDFSTVALSFVCDKYYLIID